MSNTYSTPFTYPLEQAKETYADGDYDAVGHYIEQTLHHWPAHKPAPGVDYTTMREHRYHQEMAEKADDEARQLLLLQMLCLSKLKSTDNLLQHAYHWVGRRRAWHRLSRTTTAGSPIAALGRKLRNRPTKTAITETETFLGL